MWLRWLDSAHNLNWNRLWQKQAARWRCILLSAPPLSSSGSSQAVPPDILSAGHFYLLCDFTLTSWTSGRAGNTKATFQFSLKDNGLPCHFFASPMQEINPSAERATICGRSSSNRGDLTIPFRSIRRSGDEVSRFSSASHPGYHPPTGWQTQTQRVIEETDHLPCFSLGFDSSCGEIQYISNLAKWQQRWRCDWIESESACRTAKLNKKITFHEHKHFFLDRQDAFRIFCFFRGHQ